jgi:hypothetical protein
MEQLSMVCLQETKIDEHLTLMLSKFWVQDLIMPTCLLFILGEGSYWPAVAPLGLSLTPPPVCIRSRLECG